MNGEFTESEGKTLSIYSFVRQLVTLCYNWSQRIDLTLTRTRKKKKKTKKEEKTT